ncbi:Uncharacterised protein [Mobiluncus curtisii subsp. curtisii]|nr:Uncharacterised protein [Mobiluncus curtisii subsp. curtisii]
MNPSRAVARLAQVMGLHKPPAVTFRCNSAQRFVRPDKIGKPQTAGLCHSHRPEPPRKIWNGHCAVAGFA